MGTTRNLRKVLPALLALIAVTAGCRIDMHMQPYYRTMAKSDFFADDRSGPLARSRARWARGDLREDTYFYTGKIGNAPGDYLPFPVTEDVLARGRERFNINCTPCHGRVGDGEWFHPHARIPPSAVVSHRASAQSADRLLLRRYDQRFRRHARIWYSGCAARSLVHRRIHPRTATEPGCNFDDRSCRTKNSVTHRRSSAISVAEPHCRKSRRPAPQPKGSLNDHGHSEDD